MPALPDPYVLDDAGRLVGESVQRNFDAISQMPSQNVGTVGGKSPFLQIGPGASKRSATTTVTVTFPGGSALSGYTNVVHNFGTVCRVLATPQSEAGVGASSAHASFPNPNSFAVSAWALTPPVAGATLEITVLFWEA